MFCRNCGKELNPGAAVCTQCGVPVGAGKNFCYNCGEPCAQEAIFCTKCGVAFAAPVAEKSTKSRMAAGLLGIFLGSIGVHNFYLGYTGKAVAQLLITLLTCGLGTVATRIWGLVEGIMLLTNKNSTDATGKVLDD